jgi:hypothetical protein
MQVLFEFQGTSSLVMCNGRGIDSEHPLSRLIRELHSKQPQTEADNAEVARLEWHRALYHDDEIGLYVPAANLWRCMRNAALLVDKKGGGKLIERGLAFTTDRFPLTYPGPRDLRQLYELAEYRWRGPAKIQQARVMKTWPIIPHWSLSFEAEMAEDILNFDVLVRIAQAAGRFEGLCDDRKHGRGRFSAIVAGGTTRAEQLSARANGTSVEIARV